MKEQLFVLMWTQQMTLTADLLMQWTLPVGCTLIHVSAVVSSNGSTKVAIGDGGNTSQAIAAFAAGVSGTPVEKDTADFTDPHFIAGDVLTVTIDYDGAGGTAGVNPCVVMTFLAG